MHCQKCQFLWSGKTLGIWRPKSNFVGYQDTTLYNPYNRDCPRKTRINGISNLQTPWNIYTREPQRLEYAHFYQCSSFKKYRKYKPCLRAWLWHWEWQKFENTSTAGKLLYYMQIYLDPFTANLVLHFLIVTNLLIFRLSCKHNKHDA